MPYTPNQVLNYDAAFAGASAGMLASDRQAFATGLTEEDADFNYGLTVAQVAAAFAQAIDTLFGPGVPDSFGYNVVFGVCYAVWAGRTPVFNAENVNPATWAELAGTCAAAVLAAASARDTASTTPSPQVATSAATLVYVPTTLADWSGVAPVSVQNALDRIAAEITPIP